MKDFFDGLATCLWYVNKDYSAVIGGKGTVFRLARVAIARCQELSHVMISVTLPMPVPLSVKVVLGRTVSRVDDRGEGGGGGLDWVRKTISSHTITVTHEQREV